MKKQTGMWVDSQVWEEYRKLCSRQKMRPAEPATEFLKLVLRSGSPRVILDMMKGIAEARVEGLEAYTRVLLDWYTHEKFYVHGGSDEDRAVEARLVLALRNVQNPKLRQEIEEALVASGRREQEERKRDEEEARKREEKERRERREIFGEEEPEELEEEKPEEEGGSEDGAARADHPRFFKFFSSGLPFGHMEDYEKKVNAATLEQLAGLIKICGFLMQTKAYLFWERSA